MGNRSTLSVPCAPAPGPCDVMCDIRRCPIWQGQLTKASPTWGYHLYDSKMSAHTVRVLETTRVVLMILRAIHATTHSDLL